MNRPFHFFCAVLRDLSGLCGKVFSGLLLPSLLFLGLNPFPAPLWGEPVPSNVSELPVPPGFQRLTFPEGTFCRWIQHLPLKKDHIIKDYLGKDLVNPFYRVLAVVEMPLLFKQDLEQCADFAMRFWGEHHRVSKKLSSLSLFTYGGKKLPFSSSGKSFQGFLKQAMANANSWSLLKGCLPVKPEELRPGDLIVQNQTGGIGHVSVILDTCRNEAGDRFFLIGYSFMPAQEFHIEQATETFGISGWFTLSGYEAYLRLNLNFGPGQYRRFPDPDSQGNEKLH